MQSSLDLQVLRVMVEDRERQLHRTHLRHRRSLATRRSLRRTVGRKLVRLGERLMTDPTPRPAGSR